MRLDQLPTTSKTQKRHKLRAKKQQIHQPLLRNPFWRGCSQHGKTKQLQQNMATSTKNTGKTNTTNAPTNKKSLATTQTKTNHASAKNNLGKTTRKNKTKRSGNEMSFLTKLLLCNILNIHKNLRLIGFKKVGKWYYREYHCERCGYIHFDDWTYNFNKYFEDLWEHQGLKEICEA